MQVTPAQLQRMRRDIPRDLTRYQELLKKSKHLLSEYGYEEKGEEVAKYENCVAIAQDLQNRLDSGFFHL